MVPAQNPHQSIGTCPMSASYWKDKSGSADPQHLCMGPKNFYLMYRLSSMQRVLNDIEEDQVFLLSCDSAPCPPHHSSPVSKLSFFRNLPMCCLSSKLSLFLSLPVCRRSSKLSLFLILHLCRRSSKLSLLLSHPVCRRSWARICKCFKEPRNWFPGLTGRCGNPIWRTGPPGYIGWQRRFLGIDFWGP